MMKPCIVMQSDFGLDSGLVASMHGICKRVDPTLDVSDSTHLIPPFDIVNASEALQYTIPCWPEGTIFVSVVDPGVGTDRKACVAKTRNGYYIVTPDNGTLTYVDQFYGIEAVREIDEKTNYYPGAEYVNVFHGRDLFSYCAAKLAAGIITYEQVGPAYGVEEIVRHITYPSEVMEGCARGVAFGTNGSSDGGFGILNINITNADFARTGIVFGDRVHIRLTLEGAVAYEEDVLFHKAFGYVPLNDPILHPEMNSFLGLALNQGNFCRVHHIESQKIYRIELTKA